MATVAFADNCVIAGRIPDSQRRHDIFDSDAMIRRIVYSPKTSKPRNESSLIWVHVPHTVHVAAEKRHFHPGLLSQHTQKSAGLLGSDRVTGGVNVSPQRPDKGSPINRCRGQG